MITNSRGTAFWGKPTPFITPGDIFPDIPFACSAHPAQIVKKSPFAAKANFRLNYNLFEYPAELQQAKVDPKQPGLHEMLSQGRVSHAIFLSWGSEVEDDLRAFERSGKAGGKTWIAAPIFPVNDLPTELSLADPVTKEPTSIRSIVMANRSYHSFFLKPLPDSPASHLGWYADFKKISAVRITHFIDKKDARLATLMGDTRNELYHHLLLFFTRAKIFSRSVTCSKCESPVAIDIEIQDQNQEAEPWV